MAYCVFTNCLSILGSGITPYTSLDSRSGCGMTTSVGQAAFFGSSDNVGPLGVVIQHICGNGVCRADFTSTRYGVSGNDLSLNVDAADPNTGGGLYIKYRGNVGIGTSSPDTRLHIKNCVAGGTNNFLLTLQNTCTVSDARAGIAFLDNENTVGSGGISGASIQVSNNGVDGTGNLLFSTLLNGAVTERMRMTSAGNVGIGTTSPNQKLHILASCVSGYNAGANRGLLITDSAGARVMLENPNASVCNNHRVWVMKNDFGRLSFGLLTDSGAAWVNENILTMVCEGNVGINTTSPSTKLAVEGSATDVENIARFNNQVNCTTRVWLRNSNHSAYWGLSSTSTADPLATGMCPGAMTLGFGNNFPIQFWNGSSASVKMTIASDGNVGIGTSSPSTVLDIRGCNTDNAVTVRNFCGNSYSAIGYVNCEGTLKAAVGIGNNSAAAPFANNAYVYTPASTDFLFYIAGAERMRVRCDGNVGIATTSPSYKLHVNGTFYAAGSSIKYKEGICNYDTNSCLFMCLKPVAYQYKDEFKHLGKELKADTQIGLIAEDVAEVMPELAVLVNEEDEKVVRNVDYEKLSIVLLSELQKLRKEVDELKNNK